MWGIRGKESGPVARREAPARPARTATDRHDGDLTVPSGEAWTVEGVTVDGTVRVEPGASLRLLDSVVTGRLECAACAAVIVRDSHLQGPVTIGGSLTGPAPATRGGTALLNTRVGGDVRSTGTPEHPASLILGEGTDVNGSVLTAHTELVDHGATVRVTVWNTGHLDVIDLTTSPTAVAYDMNGIAS